MKKILIIGAKGTLGTELVATFKDYQVYPWDFEELDITNRARVLDKIITLQPEIIINAAAYNNVDGAEENEELANILNGYAVGYLAEAANAIGATLVQYSTDYVFDGKNQEGYKENSEPNPISIYGKSKLLGEQEAQRLSNSCYIIRLSRLFGNMGSGQNVKKSFVDTMLKLAELKDTLEIVDEEVSSPTYAPDLALKTKNILEANFPYGIYHVSNSDSCSWCGFASEVFRIARKNIKIIPISGTQFKRLAARPQYSTLLNTKLEQQRSWQEALEDYLNNR